MHNKFNRVHSCILSSVVAAFFNKQLITNIVSILITAKKDFLPDFVGAPYEFWVGSDVPVGTSVGQIRVTEAVNKRKVMYDLLHSYHEGGTYFVV